MFLKRVLHYVTINWDEQGCTPPPVATTPVKFATPPRRVLSRRCENLKSKILAIFFNNFDKD